MNTAGPIGMHSDNGGVAQDLLITCLGAATSFITAAILAGLDTLLGFSLYSYTFWFIIPVGALASGFAGASGYYYGARAINHRPTKVLLGSIVSVSIATFFLVHYLDYRFLTVDGKAARDFVSFAGFLSFVLSHQSVQFGVGSHGIGSAVQLGLWGYLYALLQVVGFAAGGFVIYLYLEALPYCRRCAKYLAAKEKQARFTTDRKKIDECAAQMKQQVNAGRIQEAIAMHAVFGDAKPVNVRTSLRSLVEIKRCKDCNQHWMRFSISRHGQGDWQEISNTHFENYTDQPITAANLSFAATNKT